MRCFHRPSLLERLIVALAAACVSCQPALAAGPIIWGASGTSKDLTANGLVTPKLQVTETGGGTDTISVVTPSIASSWTFTLPITGGTNNYALTTNGSGTSSWSQVSLTAGVTGTLPLGNGGTGQTTAQAAINSLAGAVTDNRVLQGDGSNIALGQIDSNAFFTSGAAASTTSYGVTKASNKQESATLNLSATSSAGASATSSQGTVSITTTGGYVEVWFVPADTTTSSSLGITRGSAGASGSVRILRDSTVIARRVFQTDGTTLYFPLTLTLIDSPAAGSYTYKVDCVANTGTQTCTLDNMKLVAIEKW